MDLASSLSFNCLRYLVDRSKAVSQFSLPSAVNKSSHCLSVSSSEVLACCAETENTVKLKKSRIRIIFFIIFTLFFNRSGRFFKRMRVFFFSIRVDSKFRQLLHE